MIAAIVSLILSVLLSLVSLLFSLLPTYDWPDLAGYLTSSGLYVYFGYLNWFFPIGLALSITFGWISALIIYKLVMIFLDWLKAIIP